MFVNEFNKDTMLVLNIRKAREFRMLRGTDAKERYWNIKIK